MRKKRGFTLIEVIVVIAILGLLVLIGLPKYKGYVQEAELTRLKVECSELGEASMKYYMSKGDWPRLRDAAYSKAEVLAFGKRIVDETGEVLELEEGGKYYDLDYSKLGKYISKPEKGYNYVLQNPVGRVYAVEGVTETRKIALEREGGGVELSGILFNIKTRDSVDGEGIEDTVGGLKGVATNFNIKQSQEGGSMLFNGVADYIEFGNVLNMGKKDMTITVWIKQQPQDNQKAEGAIISKALAGPQANRYSIGVLDGHASMFINGGGVDAMLYATKKINDGMWHHVTYEYDRDADMTVYIDGVLDKGVNIASIQAVDIQSVNPFRVGIYTAGDNRGVLGAYKGCLEDIKIYGRVLTEAERLQNYMAGR